MRAHIYNTSTGGILRTVSCPDDQMAEQLGPGESYVESDIGDDATHYALGGVVTERVEHPATINKTTIAADSLETAIISNIHNLSTVRIGNGQTWQITDGVFEFTVDIARVYTITIQSVPYLDKIFTVTGTNVVPT